MNIQKALQLLEKYLNEFEHEFAIHPIFLEELFQLLNTDLKGQEDKFFKQMVTQLKNIMQLKELVNTADSNEILKHMGNDKNGYPWKLYSIHFERKNAYNIRFIISFDENHSPLLLVAFNERAGKKATDYTLPGQTAKQRKSELTKGADQYEG